MNNQRDNDFLWTFCGLSVDYILNVCCYETIGNVLQVKYPETCRDFLLCNYEPVYLNGGKSKELVPQSPLFKSLQKKAAKEFYSLLALDNLTYREQLQGEIFDYMSEDNKDTLNLWGYFDFRLGKYYDLIDRAVSNVLNQYLEVCDYEKCLKVIGEITVNCKHRLKTLHIVFLAGGGFLLLNENGEIIEADELSDEMTAAVNLGLKLDDVLSAVFIYYAPLEIVVHNYNLAGNRVSSIVWDMTGAKISFCNGCDLCNKYAGPVFAEV